MYCIRYEVPAIEIVNSISCSRAIRSVRITSSQVRHSLRVATQASQLVSAPPFVAAARTQPTLPKHTRVYPRPRRRGPLAIDPPWRAVTRPRHRRHTPCGALPNQHPTASAALAQLPRRWAKTSVAVSGLDRVPRVSQSPDVSNHFRLGLATLLRPFSHAAD